MKSGESIILCYHRVAEGVDDPFDMCVSPSNFAAHLDEISRYGEPSTLTDLFAPSPRPRVVVTFDDGYVDNLVNAVPIAEAKGVPITVFVTSGTLGSATGFWWDRLGALVGSRPSTVREASLPTPEGTVRIDLGSSTAGADLQTFRRHLLPLPVADIHRVLDAVSDQWSTPSDPPPETRPLTPSELVQLAGSPVVTIGAHTIDHTRLHGLDAQEQMQSISTSKTELERLTGRPVPHFAYPFGGLDAFDDCSVEATRSAGFETACTTIPANAEPSSDPYRLPRRIVIDWHRLRFKVSWYRWRLVPRR
jgi:peptidoglycan/xylan/chitin deacetylase (PgdA/CDA1 family)